MPPVNGFRRPLAIGFRYTKYMRIIPAYTGDIIASPFTPDEKFYFTNGDCWELARSIAELYGYPVVSAASQTDDRYWWHAANILPNGNIIDIDGIWSQQRWIDVWNDRIHQGARIIEVKQYTYQEWVDVIYWGLLGFRFPEECHRVEQYAEKVVSLIPS